MTSQDTIAVLGAGATMGKAMAANLLRAGYGVRAWNRSREKAEPLAEDGASICDTPQEAASGASVILTMLADADAVAAAMADIDARGAETPPLWLQMSTIGEAGTERCMALAAERGLTFIDAPVLGTKAPAQEGKLTVLASGPREHADGLAPIFDAIGQRTMWVGEAGAGTRLKIATNSWVLTVVEGAAETLALAAGLGLDPQLVLDAVAGGPLDLPYLQLKGKAMIDGDFAPSFRLELAAKDAGLMVASAELHDLDLPLIATIEQRLAAAVDAHGDEDVSATYLTSAPAARAS